VQTPIAPPYAEALLMNRKRAEKSASTSNENNVDIDLNALDVKAAIECENESSISEIKLISANNDFDNEPSTSTKIIQDESSEEEIVIGLQNLYQLDISDYYTDFSENNDEAKCTDETSEVLIASSVSSVSHND